MSLNAKIWGLAIFVLVGSGALTWSAKLRPTALASAAPRAAGARAAGARPAGAISATGKVEALREASVKAKGAGRILRWLKAEGDWAREGEEIVLLDQDAEKAALAEAEAEVFQTSARHKRIRILHAQKVVSDQESDDAEGAARLAVARRDRAAAALAERTLRSPFSGKILKTYLEPGESVETRGDQPLFVIGDTRRLRVRAEIDELDLERLNIGDAAAVLPDAFPGRSVAGRVVSMSGILGRRRLRSDDPKERLDGKVLEVLIELNSADGLRPGLSAEVRIKGKNG